jgi:two-component SAPR family response regulator
VEAQVATYPRSSAKPQELDSDLGSDYIPWPAAEPTHRLLVRVLGNLTVLRSHPGGNYDVVTIRRSASQKILLLLALHRQALRSNDIKESIWPDVQSRAAHRRFLTSLSELRRILAAAAGTPVLKQCGDASASRGARYWLGAKIVQVDLWQLQDLIGAAASTVQPSSRLALLRAAADLPMPDFAAVREQEWISDARSDVIQSLLGLYRDLADSDWRSGEQGRPRSVERTMHHANRTILVTGHSMTGLSLGRNAREL